MSNFRKILQKAYSYIINDKCTLSLIIFMLFILITSIILRVYMNKRRYEHFDTIPEKENIPNIQTGLGPITQTGKITFPKPFTKTPSVFTQIIGTNQTINKAYSIQVFNITTTGFEYSKNELENKPAGEFVALTLGPSSTETFTWLAFA